VTITVALAQVPGILGDLLESVVEEDPGFSLLARVAEPDDVAAAAGGRRLDAVVVCSADGSVPGAADRLLERTCAAVVAVSPDGKSASVRGRDGETVSVPDPSPGELLDSIRVRLRASEGTGNA
jgi:hypothetical protein